VLSVLSVLSVLPVLSVLVVFNKLSPSPSLFFLLSLSHFPSFIEQPKPDIFSITQLVE
jgi:hypothetical protein